MIYSWFTLGDLSPLVFLWTAILSVATIAVLMAWSYSVKGDHGNFQDVMGPLMLNWWMIPIFAIWNAAIEEIEFRGFHLAACLQSSNPAPTEIYANHHYTEQNLPSFVE